MRTHLRLLKPILAAACVALLASCGGNGARISGHFPGADSLTVVLEQLAPAENVVAGTAVTDSDGDVRLRVKLPDGRPTFYNLKVGGETIPLFISPGERVRITSGYGNPAKYSVEGSRESELIARVHDIMTSGLVRLDSIASASGLLGLDTTGRGEGLRAWGRERLRIKREQLSFVIENSGTLAALYALNQRLPSDGAFFMGENDVVYYRLVADSVSKYYPDTPYLAPLRERIQAAQSRERMERMMAENLGNPASFPEIDLPDMYGERHRLSSLLGKVILLDFRAVATATSALDNAELKNIYDEFRESGLEIYQIGVDESRAAWIEAVQAQRLPWISVTGPRRAVEIALGNYNVASLPANYLINAEGDIVTKNIFDGAALRREIGKLTK